MGLYIGRMSSKEKHDLDLFRLRVCNSHHLGGKCE